MILNSPGSFQSMKTTEVKGLSCCVAPAKQEYLKKQL